ncbi:MAG: phenylalanine--tRNA ligase subunit beta [Desulfosudaceae bacterium]
MQVSLSWLQQYVSVTLAAADLSEALTMSGLEVEGWYDRYDYLERVVTGRITAVSPHPDADRLRICQVTAGDAQYSVVCGAPNAAEGLLAALALPGTELPGGMTVKKGKIRGVVSAGMLCSELELGLGEDGSGIMELDPAGADGQSLNRALSLSDPVFEIDLTPNRPDCTSIIGVAREVAFFSRTRVQRPDIRLTESAPDITELTSVTIEDPDLCPRYAARVAVDITVGPAPFWLRDRLLSVGLKPINNIVDITNFVMMETGQPLHAFDLDRLAENRIVVRRAGAAMSFTTLDEKERQLSPDMLMICDAEKPVAVAGVMGGRNSEIGENTRRVLIESACFHPASIRKTAKALNMGSDASYRFERGVDPQGTVTAADRAAQLMAELAGGRIAAGVIDNHPRPAAPRIITVDTAAVNRRLGTAFSAGEMADFLEAVEFGAARDHTDQLAVTVPSFRVDVERPEDISEEVARLWGYNKIPVTFPAIALDAGGPETTFASKARIKELMAGFGFLETINYSFISREANAAMSFPEASRRAVPIEILNPLASDQSVMRTSLIPGLLLTLRLNLAQQIKDMKLFEIGRVFWQQEGEGLPREPDMMAALQTGSGRPRSWSAPARACDFYDLKGVCENLLGALGQASFSFTALPEELCTFTRPGHTARIEIDGTEIGLLGEVAPAVLSQLGVKQPAFAWEFNLSTLLPLLSDQRQMKPLPRFPAVTRDITIIVDAGVEAGRVLNFLATASPELIESVQMMDVYEGQPVPEGKKSLSARVVYRSADKTLKDKYVNRVHQEVADRLIAAFSADLPA